MIRPIETAYAGCRFRSRLEARWAVFFDTLRIPWQYEPQGFALSDGRRYLPDFLLPECGTWIEVKGDESRVDEDLLRAAAGELPELHGSGEQGPRLMLLGPVPPPQQFGDYGWKSFDQYPEGIFIEYYGFGLYHKNSRPWWLSASSCSGELLSTLGRTYLTPGFDDLESNKAQPAYRAARAARFEHGERG